jgi:hypothetical protein
MIKYKYAIAQSGTIIKIDSLSKEPISRDQSFTCISCKRPLIPRLGNIRQKHFAHKSPYKCSNETYLHKLAIQLFYQEYLYCLSNSLPFFIEAKQLKICSLKHEELGYSCELIGFTKFDLTKYYKSIFIEEKEENLIPDITLYRDNQDEKLFIEIAVTHFLEPKKINSGYRIIELKIESESDLEPIKKHLISSKDSNITFLNFKIETAYGNFCNGICKKKFGFFLVEKSGNCKIYTYTLTKISEYLHKNQDIIKHFKVNENLNRTYSKYKYLIAKYYLLDKSAKNCYICKNFKNNTSPLGIDPPIHCKLLGTKNHSNKASECNHFDPDDRLINSYVYVSSDLLDNGIKNKSPIELYD